MLITVLQVFENVVIFFVFLEILQVLVVLLPVLLDTFCCFLNEVFQVIPVVVVVG